MLEKLAIAFDRNTTLIFCYELCCSFGVISYGRRQYRRFYCILQYLYLLVISGIMFVYKTKTSRNRKELFLLISGNVSIGHCNVARKYL